MELELKNCKENWRPDFGVSIVMGEMAEVEGVKCRVNVRQNLWNIHIHARDA